MHVVELLDLEGRGALEAQRATAGHLERGALFDLRGDTRHGDQVLVPVGAPGRIDQDVPDIGDRRLDQSLLPPGRHQDRTGSRAREASAGAPSSSYSAAASSRSLAASSGSLSRRSLPWTTRQRAASSGRPSSPQRPRARSIFSAASSGSSAEAPAASAVAASPTG